MAIFSKRIPRLAVLAMAVAGLAIVPLEVLAHGPNLCLWRHLFRISACPSCGSTRALAAFFHGEFSAAWKYNHNVVVTGPGLAIMLARDLFELLVKWR